MNYILLVSGLTSMIIIVLISLIYLLRKKISSSLKKKIISTLIVLSISTIGIGLIPNDSVVLTDSLVKSDYLITKTGDYAKYGFFNVTEPVIYDNNVLCEGNIPLVISFDKVVDNKNFLGCYEQSKNSFSAVNYVYEILVNETYSYQIPVYKTVKDVSKNGTVTEYTVIDYYLNKTSYRWVWKNLNELSSFSIVKDKVVVINIKGRFKAGLGFRSIDVIPSITIGNERQNLVKYAWWNTSYTYNLPVWVDYSKITTDLVNFPVAFFIDDTTADKMNGGKSFRPVSSDNTTVYDYMIDTWVDGADRIVYVEVPRVESDSYTLVNLYYGNASATDLSNKVNTYSNSIYTDVYNCSEASGNLLGLKDVYDFTKSGSPTYAQVGQVGKCVYIDADSDYFVASTNFSIFDTGGWSMWAKVTHTTAKAYHEGLVSIPNSASAGGIHGDEVINGSYQMYSYNIGGTSFNIYGDAINLTTSFHHIGFYYDKTATTVYLYIDGVLRGGATISGNLRSAYQKTYIGVFSATYTTGSNSVHAYVDELHFFPGVVNASWFKAEYNSGADTLLIWGTERTSSISYTATIRNYGTDYFVWLGTNMTAYWVNQTIAGMNEAGESISIWNRTGWSDAQGLWQTYNGTRTGVNWTVHTFNIIRVILDDAVGNQTVTMLANPSMNYTNTKAIILVNTTTNKGYNFSGYNRVAATTLSVINTTAIGLTAGDMVARWNRTGFKWDIWISGFGPNNYAVVQWNVIQTKVSNAETWNT